MRVDQLGEVGEGAGESVDLVDDDDVDPLGANVVEDGLQGRALHRSPGVAAVIIAAADQFPAFMGLTFDVGFEGLALIVEGVELLFEAVLGGDAGVDCAAQGWFAIHRFHDAASG